ncbi:MAG: Crp/Fnr family transcriptional regulator [Paludibacteraceae bacterium]|nr:Crp/Fnr family transcriptional regulator [Paludibacteraceae bacterium]
MHKLKNIDLLLYQFQTLGIADKIPPEALDAAVSLIQVEEYNKRDLIVKKGEICKKWFFVGEGIVRVFFEKNGTEITDLLAPEGWAFPMVECYYGNMPANANVEALEPCKILILEKDPFLGLQKQYPELAYITRAILKRFLIYNQHRVDSLMFETAEEKYDRLLANIPKILLRVPSLYVASFLGITPETLSRVRAKKTKK